MLELTTIVANVATACGVPLALAVFWLDRRRAQRDREQRVYQAMQAEYQAFLSLCFDHPEMGLHTDRPAADDVLSDRDRERRRVALEMLVSMLESAFFLYQDGHRSHFRRRQWTGWRQYMSDWAAQPVFREAWRQHLGTQFDVEFVAFMNRLVREQGAGSAGSASASASASNAGPGVGGGAEGGGR